VISHYPWRRRHCTLSSILQQLARAVHLLPNGRLSSAPADSGGGDGGGGGGSAELSDGAGARMAAPPALRKACASGDLPAVLHHLDGGESPNGLCDEKTGETLLFVAAQNGHDQVCQQLIAAGAFAYVNKGRFLDAATPLHMAAGKGHSLVVQALLDGRAVPDRADSHAGRTPLFYAASRGQHDAVHLLLDAGSDPNWLDQQGVVPLYVAAQNGKALVVDLLLRAGALVDGVASTAASGTWRKGTPAFIPLHAAAKHGHLDCLRRLLSNEADPRLETASGQTALHIAAQNGQREIAELLARACVAAVNHPAADGTTPLAVASGAGHAPCCDLLLRCRANPNIPDNRGVTPIAAALKKGRAAHAAVVAALLDAGCTYTQQIVQDASKDRTMAGYLALAENRRLVGAMQRLAWAQMLCTSSSRSGSTTRERSRAQLVLAEPLLRRSCMQLPAVSLAVAGRTMEERARVAISIAAASRNKEVVAATLKHYRQGVAEGGGDPLVSPALQHALAPELAQLEASLGQLQHQEFRKKYVHVLVSTRLITGTVDPY
jgi:ankyrin repeat protein